MYSRSIFKKLRKHFYTQETVVITGARQVGKTITLRWILNQLDTSNKIYIDLERLDNREIFNEKNYENILNFLENRGIDLDSKAFVAVDEIQLAPNLPSVVKYLYDHYKIKFFLSGSSSFYLKNLFTQSMAGRKVVFELYPLSFGEFLAFNRVKFRALKRLDSGKFDEYEYERLKSYYEEYIEYGGMPKVVLTKATTQKVEILKEIYSAYINFDVVSLTDFRSIKELRLLIKLLAARIGNIVDVNKLSKLTGLSRPTVYSYLDFLEMTYIIKLIPAFSKSEDIKVRLGKKVYFVDNGIANVNADLSGGAKFENAVAAQLRSYGDLSYYNRGEFGEIDFIVNNAGYEVKERPVDTDMRKIKRISEKIGLRKCCLIGRYSSPRFDEYLWGGQVF